MILFLLLYLASCAFLIWWFRKWKIEEKKYALGFIIEPNEIGKITIGLFVASIIPVFNIFLIIFILIAWFAHHSGKPLFTLSTILSMFYATSCVECKESQLPSDYKMFDRGDVVCTRAGNIECLVIKSTRMCDHIQYKVSYFDTHGEHQIDYLDDIELVECEEEVDDYGY